MVRGEENLTFASTSSANSGSMSAPTSAPLPDAVPDAEPVRVISDAATDSADVAFQSELKWKRPRNVLRDTWVSAKFALRNRELSWTVPSTPSSVTDRNVVEVLGWTTLPDRGGRTQPHRFDLLCCKQPPGTL